jgi:hypothetical protein
LLVSLVVEHPDTQPRLFVKHPCADFAGCCISGVGTGEKLHHLMYFLYRRAFTYEPEKQKQNVFTNVSSSAM